MKASKRSISFEALFSISLLVLVSAIAYLPLIRRFGYYRDDWYLMYGGMMQGARKFIEIYSIDRPFIGYFMAGLYTLFGNQAFYYALSGYAIRLVGALGLLWMLRMVWPKQKLATTLAALLFLVFPGFLQLPNAIVFQPHFLGVTLAIFSIALTVRATLTSRRSEKILLTALAMFLALLTMLLQEYYIGLEGLRFFLLWYLTSREAERKFSQNLWITFLRWLPYLGTIAIFLFWRVVIFKPERPNTDTARMALRYLISPLDEILNSAADLVKDFFEIVLLSWAVPAYQTISGLGWKALLITLALALLAGGLVYFGYKWLERKGRFDLVAALSEENGWARAMVWIGALSVLVASVPIIFGGRDVRYFSNLDRYTFSGSIGAVMVVIGGLFLALRGRLRLLIPTFLVVVAVMVHYQNAAHFASWWETARNFWWQMSWRAPQLEKNTVLLARMPGYSLEEDYETWAPANMIYSPITDTLIVKGDIIYPASVQNVITRAVDGRTVRTFYVYRRFNKTLVISQPTASSCLHVLNKLHPLLSTWENPDVALIAPYSRADLVLSSATPAVPPASIFGKEPGHGWCYFYEKADLAWQDENWNEISQLGEQAAKLGLTPGDPVEWAPFAWGTAYNGEYEKSTNYIKAISTDPYLKFQACQFAQQELPQSKNQAAAQFLNDAFCSPSP